MPHLHSNRLALAVVAACLAMAPLAAHAQPTGDRTAADTLFYEAKQLRAEGRDAEACARLEASVAILRRLGAVLNLADCNEAIGKTATAWVLFGEAAAMAHELADSQRETYARSRLGALEPRLSRLAVMVSPPRPGSLEVRRNGEALAPALYDVAMPLDPGEHEIEALVAGRVVWSTTVLVEGEGEVRRVEVAALDLAAPAPAPETTARPSAMKAQPPPPASSGSVRKILTWTSVGIGVAGVGTGSYFGLSARNRWKRAEPDCDARGRCRGEAYGEALRARHDGIVSTAAFAVGGAALATGLLLYLTAPDQPRERAHPLLVTPSVAPDAMTLTVEGRF